MSKINRRLLLVAKFLILFNLLAVPLYIAIYTNFSFQPLQDLVAWLSNYFLQILGFNTSLQENVIITLEENVLFRFDVSWDSTGWKSMYAVTALALATPVLVRKKIKFICVALPAIFAINVFRIVATISWSLTYGFEYFELLHKLLWREALIIAVVGFWLFWVYRQRYNIGKN